MSVPPLTVRLFHGDIRTCPLLVDGSADAIITSPPYNLRTAYDTAHDERTFAEYEVFITTTIKTCARALAPGGLFAVNVADLVRGGYGTLFLPKLIERAMATADLDYLGANIWIKWSGSELDPSDHWRDGYFPGRPQYHSVTEWIMVFAKGAPAGQPCVNEVWHIKRSEDKSVHPAAWPEDLCRRLISSLTRPGDVVLDPFAGLGTLAGACVETGRTFIGYDTSRRYLEVAAGALKGKTDVAIIS